MSEDRSLTQEECEAIIESTLDAVHEQLLLPLLMALGTLTVELTKHPVQKEAISASLREQRDSCPADVSGRVYLDALYQLAKSDSDAREAVFHKVGRNVKLH